MSVQMWLPDTQFNDVIRMIKRSRVDNVELLVIGARARLKELKARPKPDKAVSGVPEGNNQVNVGSIVTWMNKIDRKKKGFKRSIRQLVVIEATATKRLTG